MARTLPLSVQLDGFDIDLTQCPPKAWLPSNVAMHHLDVFADIPQQMIGKYDIIHLRLFLLIVRDNDPSPLLNNVLKMLSK